MKSLLTFSLRLPTTLMLIALLACLNGCNKTAEELVFKGSIMGTHYRISVIVNQSQSSASKSLLESRLLAAMEAVNESMSTYIATSEISRFNQLKSGESIEISEQFNDVLIKALEINKFTNKAFDPTLGKVIKLWGFGEDGHVQHKPDDQTLQRLKNAVGTQYLRLEGRQLSKLANALELNLSAIAKGYAVDRVADVLEQRGYTNYLIDIGGELRAKGFNTTNQPWRIGIEKPSLIGGVAQVVALNDQAIATSGDYRNFLLINGEQFSHTIDSTTLKPVFHKLASVSVLANSAMTADALATALLAMGDEQGIKFAEQQGLHAYFIIRGKTADNFKTHATNEFITKLSE